jgi:hypothetical protein
MKDFMQERKSRLGSRKEYALGTFFCLVLSLAALRQAGADSFFVRRDYAGFAATHLWSVIGSIGLTVYWAWILWQRCREIRIHRLATIFCATIFSIWWGLALGDPLHRGLLIAVFALMQLPFFLIKGGWPRSD